MCSDQPGVKLKQQVMTVLIIKCYNHSTKINEC